MQEITRAQKARLGLFLLVAGALLTLLIVIVTGLKFLEKRDFYFVRYQGISVSGLEIGAQVKYYGVRVGRVDDVFIDPKDVETIVVKLSLRKGTPVAMDVQAVLSSMSLTGLKQIELDGGTKDAPLREPGTDIPAGSSAMQLISGKAEVIAEKIETVLTNLVILTSSENQDRILTLVDNTSLVLADVHDVLANNKESVDEIMDNLTMASIGVREIAESNELRNAIANLDMITTSIKDAEFEVVVSELQVTLSQIQKTFQYVDLTLLSGRYDLLRSLETLRESLDSFNEFARMISEDPSLLLRGTRDAEPNRIRLR